MSERLRKLRESLQLGIDTLRECGERINELEQENATLKSELEARVRELDDWSSGHRSLPRWDLIP